MGKSKKNNRINTNLGFKKPLDQEIEDGRVRKPKNRNKLRLRAEEEDVRICGFFFVS